MPPKARGGTDPQGAIQLVSGVPQCKPRALGGVPDRPSPRVEASARLRQPQAPRAPCEQRQADGLLDRCDPPADRRTRQAQVAPRLRKAARLGNASEQLQCVGIERRLGGRLTSPANAGRWGLFCRHFFDKAASTGRLVLAWLPI